MLRVNCWAEEVCVDKWTVESEHRIITLGRKSSWYWTKIGRAPGIIADLVKSTHHDDALYLVRDNVGYDGYGLITIYRNVSLVFHAPLPLTVKQSPATW